MSSGTSGSSLLSSPIKVGPLGDGVGRGTPESVGEGVVDEVVVGGGLGDGVGVEVEVEEYEVIGDGSGVDSTDLVALPLQITSQESLDKALSTLSQT